jgi:hypothetical protein
MPKKPTKLGVRKRLKEELQRQEFSSDFRILNQGNSFTQGEFQTLLEESEFIPKIIEAYRRDALRGFEDCQDADPWRLKAEEDFQRCQAFIEEYLAVWLYKATDLLTLQAPFASTGNPIPKAALRDLILDVFVDNGPPTAPLKSGRKEIWDRHTLLWVLGKVLLEINVNGTITLAVVAKKINALAKQEYRLWNIEKPLTEKHLQKLFKKHDIDWKIIKKAHKRQLIFRKTH